MTSLLRLFVLAALLSSGAIAVPSAQPRVTLERHEFLIHDFHTESGVVLPEARVVYTTLGTLNANGDNAVLLPSHYMATFSGYNWLIRGADPDRALDPAHDFLVLTELFGNGRSSSPSNTPEPYHGPRFPVMTIRDNVEAVHRLVTGELHVRHVRAVVGFSMGAEQAFQWAVSHAGDLRWTDHRPRGEERVRHQGEVTKQPDNRGETPADGLVSGPADVEPIAPT